MSSSDRQRVVRVGARRARLTAAPGTEAEPVSADEPETTDAPTRARGAAGASGPNDERMRNDVPPHY